MVGMKDWGLVLVSGGCRNKVPQTGGLESQKSPTKMLAGLVPSEAVRENLSLASLLASGSSRHSLA